MSVYEKVRSIICYPTEKCCKKIYPSYNQKKVDFNNVDSSEIPGHNKTEEAHQSVKRALLNKIHASKPINTDTSKIKKSKNRKPTGWNPHKKLSDEEEEEDDIADVENDTTKKQSQNNENDDGTKNKLGSKDNHDPIENKRDNKSVVALSVSGMSTRTDIGQRGEDGTIENKWTNKDLEVYSSEVTLSLNPSATNMPYWLKSNLQYFIMLPTNKRHRPTPPPALPIAPVDEENAAKEENTPTEENAAKEENTPTEENTPKEESNLKVEAPIKSTGSDSDISSGSVDPFNLGLSEYRKKKIKTPRSSEESEATL